MLVFIYKDVCWWTLCYVTVLQDDLPLQMCAICHCKQVRETSSSLPCLIAYIKYYQLIQHRPPALFHSLPKLSPNFTTNYSSCCVFRPSFIFPFMIALSLPILPQAELLFRMAKTKTPLQCH
jgi:hypothetical protein